MRRADAVVSSLAVHHLDGPGKRLLFEARAIAKDPECRLAAQHNDEPCPICERPIRPIVGAEINSEVDCALRSASCEREKPPEPAETIDTEPATETP